MIYLEESKNSINLLKVSEILDFLLNYDLLNFYWICQKIFQIIFSWEKMGGVLSVVEIVLAVGFIAEGVAEAVIKAQIKELMKGHEEEFRLMN